MNRRRLLWLVPIALLAAGLATWAFRHEKGPRVDAVSPVRGALVQTLVTSGRVIQRRQSELGAQIQSTVVEVAIEEGAEVEADALLVRLADDDARAALEEAEAAVAEAEARFQRVRGVGRRMAAEGLQQARIDAEQAQVELRGQSEALDELLATLRAAEEDFQTGQKRIAEILDRETLGSAAPVPTETNSNRSAPVGQPIR